jgi:hypothetical protein
MNDNCIQADSFILKSHGIRIYRIQQEGSATVLWGCPEEASRYLQIIKGQELRAKEKGR